MKQHHAERVRLLPCLVFGFSLVLPFASLTSLVQAASPITPSGLNTQVTLSATPPSGKTQYDITGGTRPGGGVNLFHSFGDFNVPTNNIANFLNSGSIDLAGNPLAAGLPTSNILGRINGGNPSSIFGMIQTNGPGGFPNANLFLMNPNGFLFGPTATINVGGMASFTTADYIRHTDNTRFNAVEGPADLLLTAAPVAAFGFLGNNPAAIAIQGSTLQVADGKALSFVGGNQGFMATDPDTGNPIPVPGGITMTGGKLSAPGGQINVASVAGPGEISALDFMPTPGMTMGNISLSQGALIDVSADAAGTVRIRGGQLLMDTAVISADTIDANGAPIAIDINVTGNVSISNTDIAALTARTIGDGNAGEIKISSNSMDVTSTFDQATFFFPVIDTHTSGSGNAGNVTINTGNLTVTGDPSGASFFIDSGTSGPTPGRGGDVSITAKTIDFETTGINTGNLFAFFLDQGGAGTAGNVTINADKFQMNFSQIVTDSNDFVTPVGTSGDITITAREVDLFASGLSTTAYDHSGNIRITADQFIATESQIQAITTFRSGGEIRITGNVIEFRDGSNIASSTMADGDAGPIIISASDHLAFLESSPGGRPGGIFNNSFGDRGSLGNAGDVVIATPNLQLTGGTRINTTTASSGRGGNVTINADSISMSGENSGFEIESLFNLGTTQSSGIYTRTIGGNCTGPCGNAGNISITTGSLTMGSGAQINSGTSSSGQGGNITITAANTISVSGTLTTGQPGGIQSRTTGTDPDAGAGGNISLIAGQSVTISEGASVAASTTGLGKAGNILVKANDISLNGGATITAASSGAGNAGTVTVQGLNSPANSFVVDGAGSGIFTDTSSTGAGGNIFINANSVTLSNGGTLSATTSGPEASATGGTITIAASDVQLSNSALITAQTTGAGNAGAITITADNSVSLEGSSAITSTSFFNTSGNGGPVSITAPTVSLQDSSIVTFVVGFGSEISTAGAGDVTINASKSVSLLGGNIDSSIFDTAGNAGHISITSPTVSLSKASTISSAATNSSFNPDFSPVGLSTDGNGGLVELAVGQLMLASGSQVTTQNGGGGLGGNVTVHGMGGMGSTATDVTITSGAGILTNATDLGAAGHITVDTARLTISDGGQMQAATLSAGTGGTITIRATEQVIISGEALICPTCSAGTRTLASQINTSSDGAGRAGNILIESPTLSLSDGGRIVASAFGSGAGGIVTVQGPQGTGSMANSFLASGHSSEGAISGIFTDTQGTGSGGSISVNANSVTLQNGGTLSAKTSGTQSSAAGGTITIDANQVQLNSGGLITAATSGAGAGGSITIGAGSTFASNAGTVSSSATQATGGDINISAGQSVTLDNRSLITASSNGAGNAGNIVINAGQQYTSTNSSVTTKAEQASGGNITVLATGLVHLTNSEINASVEGSSTTVGGNILIDPVYVILQNSNILAQATQGQGGNINIFYTGALLADPSSIISASSQFGQQGTVTIQSPNAPAGGKIVPLSQKPLLASSLVNQRCAALAGGNLSSFTVAGRDSLPAEPSGWLTSPLALATSDSGSSPLGGVGSPTSQSEPPLISLRRIAPPGFLTQSFAAESSGCAS